MDLAKILDQVLQFLNFKNPFDIIKAFVDMGIVSFAVYKLFILVKETRAWQLLKGILVIIIAAKVSDILGLRTIAFIINNSIQYIAVALIVLFQPELRRGLEQIGRSQFRDFFAFDDEDTLSEKSNTTIENIIKACIQLSKEKVGALIVLEMETKIGEVINTGVQVDSNVSSEILLNIFTPNTPLHDGAVIIRENKIKAAACFLPLTSNPNLSIDLGTRHRAALGITEVSDSIAIIVSEETSKISFASNGKLTRDLTQDLLRDTLNKFLLHKTLNNKRLSLWKVISK